MNYKQAIAIAKDVFPDYEVDVPEEDRAEFIGIMARAYRELPQQMRESITEHYFGED